MERTAISEKHTPATAPLSLVGVQMSVERVLSVELRRRKQGLPRGYRLVTSTRSRLREVAWEVELRTRAIHKVLFTEVHKSALTRIDLSEWVD